MINRLIIRTRALQIAYAHQHRDEISLVEAEADFTLSLRRTYDLYLYLFRLIPTLTELYAQVVEMRKQKHLPTDRDRNPNERFIHNRLAQAISQDERINIWYSNFSLRWEDEEILLRRLMTTIENSELFQFYRSSPDTFDSDRNFWALAFQKLLLQNDDLADYLDDASIYWGNALNTTERIECEETPSVDKVEEEVEFAKIERKYQRLRLENSPTELVKEFVIKSLRRVAMCEDGGLGEVLLPQFRDAEDETFAHHLFRQLFLKREERQKLIDEALSEDWERERLADIDHLLIEMGIIEFLHFPAIATSVTINEYVELAKYYSTSKSSSFINGVLDNIAKRLKEEKRILKN